eukprot:3895910-Amphidinium_carterae.1
MVPDKGMQDQLASCPKGAAAASTSSICMRCTEAPIEVQIWVLPGEDWMAVVPLVVPVLS